MCVCAPNRGDGHGEPVSRLPTPAEEPTVSSSGVSVPLEGPSDPFGGGFRRDTGYTPFAVMVGRVHRREKPVRPPQLHSDLHRRRRRRLRRRRRRLSSRAGRTVPPPEKPRDDDSLAAASVSAVGFPPQSRQ